MAAITVQMGHCFRVPIPGKDVRTGGRGEQKFAKEVADRLGPLLEERGHTVRIIKADEVAKSGDVFIALHTDGNGNPAARGASVGFPDANGKRLAHAWKRAHKRAGFPGGFRGDNNTTDASGYYGFRKHANHKFRFLAEHGMASNETEFAWMHSNFDACADAHVAAVSEVVGDPIPPQPDEDDVLQLTDGSTITFAADGDVVVAGDMGHFKGSMKGRPMNAPVIGGAMSDDETGYWLVGADGGIFTFNAPAIQPYLRLLQEHRAGKRAVVRVSRQGPGLLLVSNLGETYVLEPSVGGKNAIARRKPVV